MTTLIDATKALYDYLQRNDKTNGSSRDQARMLARDANIPVDPTARPDDPRYAVGFRSIARKQEVILSRIEDTYACADEAGFTRSHQFQQLWDEMILIAIADGYHVSAAPRLR